VTGRDLAEAGPGAADPCPDAPTSGPDAPAPIACRPPPGPRPKRRAAGVSVIAGGLLQDLEERMRQQLPPIEQRMRIGTETRVLAAGNGGLVVMLPDPGTPDAG